MRATIRLVGLLGRRRQRRRLRRPHHRRAECRRPRQRAASVPATATWCSARPAGFAAAIDLAHVAAGNGGFVIHGAGCGRLSPACRSPRPATSTATASTTSSSGRSTATAPATARDSAGDSYVVFGQAGGFAAAIDLADGRRRQRRLRHPWARTRTTSPAGRCPRPATSTATASTTSSSAHPAPTARQRRARCRRQLCGVRQGRRASRPTIDLATVAAGNGGFVIHGRGRGRPVRHVGRPRPATSTATASTTSSSAHACGDGPGGTGASSAGDSYVLFGSATIGDSVNHVTHLGTAAADS